MQVVRRVLAGATYGLVILTTVGPAYGQVCGDATGNGTVTDADAVEVLRAAALLPSACTPSICDVNGDGTIDDTDGVITFRLTLALPVETACSPGGGGDAEVEMLSDDLAPFFGILLPQAPGVGAAGAGIVTTVEDCPAGGTRTKRDLGVQLQVQLDLCRINDPLLGSFEFDGNVALNLALPQFFMRVDVTDLATARTVHFEGPIDAAFGAGDTVLLDGGPIVIATPQGDFDMTFDELVVDDDGRPRGGAATVTDTDDNFDLAVVSFEVNDDITADLVAEFDDGSSSTFLLNLVTGALTPIG